MLLLLNHLLLDQRLCVDRSSELLHEWLAVLNRLHLLDDRLCVDRLDLLHNYWLNDLLLHDALTNNLTLNQRLASANHLTLDDGVLVGHGWTNTGRTQQRTANKRDRTKRMQEKLHDPPSFLCKLSNASINGPLDSSGSLWSLGMLPSSTDLRASTIWSPVRFVWPSYTMPPLGVAPE